MTTNPKITATRLLGRPIRSRALLGAFLALAALWLAGPLAAFAQEDQARTVFTPILHNWQDPGNAMTVQTPTGNYFYQMDVDVPLADGSGSVRLTDRDHRLWKGLMRCSTGMPVKLYVSLLVPGLLVGMEDFEGQVLMAERVR